MQHDAGAAGVLLVNERIVEQPFVFAALAGLPDGARIVDVGGSESTVGLSLATLGHRVTVVDPRAHPLRHPNLDHAICTLDELPDPMQPFDAAVALSAVAPGVLHQPEATTPRTPGTSSYSSYAAGT